MKKFLLKSSLFLLLLGAIYSMLIVYAVFLSPTNSYHYIYAHANKMARLDSLPEPRLIIVGGSNAAFGLNSREIGDSLGRNAVNTAVHAGIGLRFMMDEVITRVRPGDMIIIIPEYSQFFSAYNGTNESLASAVIYSGPQAWRLLNPTQIITTLDGIPKHLVGNARATAPANGQWTYSSVFFNDEGDEYAHWTAPATGVIKPQSPISKEFDPAAASDFANKVNRLRAIGCNVHILWPTTIESNFNVNLKPIATIKDALAEEGVTFDSEPSMLIHGDSLAFDTPYHMTYPAVEENTRRIIKLLREKGY